MSDGIYIKNGLPRNEKGQQIVSTERRSDRLMSSAGEMLDLLKAYVANDPCAAGDPRYASALRIIRYVETPPRDNVTAEHLKGAGYPDEECQ